AADKGCEFSRFVQCSGKLVEIRFDCAGDALLRCKIEQGDCVTPCQAGLNTGGKLHAKVLLGPRKTEIFGFPEKARKTAPRRGWRAPITGFAAMQPGWGKWAAPIAPSLSFGRGLAAFVDQSLVGLRRQHGQQRRLFAAPLARGFV